MAMNDLKALKKQYSDEGINKQSTNEDPFVQFRLWFDQALDSGIAEPNGFCLSTVSSDSKPSVRTVLMKGFDHQGFVFFTNHGSRKGQQLAENPSVSMLFPWYELHRQINIEGEVTRVSDKQSFEYFQSRPKGSQIGAWASRQSEVIENRAALEAQIDNIEQRFGDEEIPLPEFWGGYLIKPRRFEFWQGRTHRLHDRIVYTKNQQNHDNWEVNRLAP